jgi:hypothetical protein
LNSTKEGRGGEEFKHKGTKAQRKEKNNFNFFLFPFLLVPLCLGGEKFLWTVRKE